MIYNYIFYSSDLDLLISKSLLRTTVHGFVNDLLETPDNTTLCGANNNGMFYNGLFDSYMLSFEVIR